MSDTDKFKGILISLLFVTALLVTMTVYFSDFNTKYTPTTYYTENLSSMQSSLSNTTYYLEQTREGIDKISSGNILDILGGLKQTGVSFIKGLGSSINSATKIFTQGISIFGVGEIGSIWILVAGAVIVLIFIFVVIEKIT